MSALTWKIMAQRAGKVAQWLRARDALPEDSKVPSDCLHMLTSCVLGSPLDKG